MVRASLRGPVFWVLGFSALVAARVGLGNYLTAPRASAAVEASSAADVATVVVLPDTQYYASAYAGVFVSQTRWIVEHRSTNHIALAVQLGDIVDVANDPGQWTVASASMRIMDGLVPYVLVPGNHDTDANRAGPIDDYFAPTSLPWITGTMLPGKIENNYTLVGIGARRWLVVGLEFGPRDAVIAWADGILKSYANVPAIVVTHAYLYEDGTRYDSPISGSGDVRPGRQRFVPEAFGYTQSDGINDGERIWRRLIVPNPNVRLVLCGHDNGVARLTSFRPDGSRVHQLLSDYQWLHQGKADYQGGSGYLRLLAFDYPRKQLRVATYSPYLDQWLTDESNQFTLDLDP